MSQLEQEKPIKTKIRRKQLIRNVGILGFKPKNHLPRKQKVVNKDLMATDNIIADLAD